MERRGPFPVHPLLLALYGPLALAVENASAGVTPGDLWLPLLLSAGFAAFGGLVALVVVKERHRRGLVAAALVLFLAFGGMAAQSAARALSLAPDSVRWVVVLELAVVYATIVFALRTTRALQPLTRFLNLVTALLLAFAVLRGTRSWMRASGEAQAAEMKAPAGAKPTATPDIYYIVLDSYSSGRLLASQYGHDNGPFESALRSRGFVVPRRAKANYIATHLSLAAALNWTYLHDLANDPGRESGDRTRSQAMIERSRAASFLKARGYQFVFLPTSYGGTARNREADVTIARQGASEFQAVWFHETSLPLFVRFCGSALGVCRAQALPFNPEGAEAMRWKLARLAELPRDPAPKLVLAHLMIPHEPFVFRPDCSARESYWPQSAAEDAAWRAAYAEQVACVNALMLTLVDSLIRSSRTPPVVILQGDHGHGRFPLGRAPRLDEVTREQVEDRTHVFAAYHLPGVPPEAVHDSISPVNVWPILLTHYFGTPTPPLPDETYWSSADRPFDFKRVQ